MKKKISRIFFLLISPAIIYLIGALVFGLIQTGESEKKENASYLVYVISGNIHTEFIFPLKNDLFDWRSLFPLEQNFGTKIGMSYVSIGWGSKDFFFEMKTWDPFKIKVILKAVFVPSDSAVHVDFLRELPANEVAYPLNLGKDNYLKLVQFVLASFEYDRNSKVQQIGTFSYYGTDRFFKGSKKYHLFHTCNMWTNEGLKSINWKRPIWSPFKYSIESALKEQGRKWPGDH
ncbi:MAG: DUF2459 domain-containing protein [Bacteriovorax sp.]